LAHAAPCASIEEIHLRAMRALMAEPGKKEYGAAAASTKKPRQRGAESNHREQEVRVAAGADVNRWTEPMG
jgi:hypothetical protein